MANPSRKSLVVLGSVLLVLFVAGAIALAVLDSVLLKQAKAQASIYSQKLDRPITIEGISTKILFGPSVRVSGIEIGPGAGEELPLLELQRVEVKPKLFKAIVSRGKQVEIDSVKIDGLALNLIRFADETTNVERLQAKLSEAAKPERAVEDKNAPQGPEQPLGMQLDHFALSEGRIRFIEQTQGKARRAAEPANALEVRHIEVRVDNLRAEEPLDVVVKAAVLAEQQNFELDLTTAPLPASLVPTPKRVALKVQPIDLKPIAPYLPRSIGLREGRLSADLNADLGAVVPGGKGETRIRGVLNALGLRFAGAEGGKPLDVALDAAVQGDASKGDLQIDRLKLDVGPAGITGKGRVLGLNSGQLRVEGLEVVAHDLDPARIAAQFPPLQRQLKHQIAGPIGLVVRGSGTEASQAIEVSVDFTPVRLELRDTLSKAPGKTMTLLAHLRGAAAGALRFDLKADLVGVDLRPGESLDKPPGEPLALSISGTKSGSGDKSAPLKIQLSEATAQIRDSTLTAKGSLEHSGSAKDKQTQFELAVQSPRLDLDKLLMTSKREKPPLDPSLFSGIRGHATAKIDSLRKSKIDFRNVLADAKMVDDEVTLQTLSMGAFGGKISANGTTMHLAQRKMPFHVIVQAQNVDVAQASTLASDRKLLAGTLSTDLNVSGAGTDKADLIHSLSGSLEGHLREGKFLGGDVIASAWAPLARALPWGIASAKPDAGGTSLGKDVPFSISIEKGYAKLKAPLQLNLPEGQIVLTGGAHLNGNLDLAGTVTLEPSIVSSLTGGKVAAKEGIPLGLKIVGSASKPTIAVVDLQGAVAAIVKDAATGVLGRLLGTGTGGSGDAIQKKAKEEEQRGKDTANSEAEKVRKEAEEKALEFLKGFRP